MECLLPDLESVTQFLERAPTIREKNKKLLTSIILLILNNFVNVDL
jgi:hypothetical protein